MMKINLIKYNYENMYEYIIMKIKLIIKKI